MVIKKKACEYNNNNPGIIPVENKLILKEETKMVEQKVNNGAAEGQAKEQPQAQQTLYTQALELVKKMVPQDKFKFNEAGSGVSIFDNGGGRGTRLLKVVKSQKGLRVEFNVNVDSKLKDVPASEKIVYSDKEAKDKHMGTCQWIYAGNDLNVLKELIQIALAGFAPKVKEEKKKDEVKAETPTAPAAEAPKQEPVKEEPPKATRQLTAEEQKQLKGNSGITAKLGDSKTAKAQ